MISTISPRTERALHWAIAAAGIAGRVGRLTKHARPRRRATVAVTCALGLTGAAAMNHKLASRDCEPARAGLPSWHRLGTDLELRVGRGYTGRPMVVRTHGDTYVLVSREFLTEVPGAQQRLYRKAVAESYAFLPTQTVYLGACAAVSLATSRVFVGGRTKLSVRRAMAYTATDFAAQFLVRRVRARVNRAVLQHQRRRL